MQGVATSQCLGPNFTGMSAGLVIDSRWLVRNVDLLKLL